MDLLILSNSIKENDIIEISKTKKYNSIILSNGYRYEKLNNKLLEDIPCEIHYLTGIHLNRDFPTIKYKECGSKKILILLNYYRLNFKETNYIKNMFKAENNSLYSSPVHKTLSDCFNDSSVLRVENEHKRLFHYLLYTYNRAGKPEINIKGNIIKLSYNLSDTDKIYAEISYNIITIKTINNDVLVKCRLE